MGHALEAYLAEITGELGPLGRGLARDLALEPFAPLPGALPRTPTLALPPLMLVRAETVAANIVRSGALPEHLPAGTTPSRVLALPTPAPTTLGEWSLMVMRASAEVNAMEAEAARRRALGTLKSTDRAYPGAHIANNYSWIEYRIPSSGACDPAELVWLDLWFQAKDVLRRLATKPFSGAQATIVSLWVQTVARAIEVLVDSANTRFFSAPLLPLAPAIGGDGGVRDEAAWRAKLAEQVAGLSSTAQGNGGYYYGRQGTAVEPAFAMQFAPRPEGGYEELLGRDIAWLKPRVVFTCLDGPHCCFTCDGLFDAFRGGTEPNTARILRPFLDAYYRSSGPFEAQVRHRNRTGLARVRVDLGAWFDNVSNVAKAMSDVRISFGEVLMRSTSFYLNAYLDYAARKGVVATGVVENARAAWEGIRGRANDQLNTGVGTTFGVITALVTAVNGAAGAIVGAVLAVVALLVGLGGAAVGTAGAYVPLPFYRRMFGGSCMDRAWLPPPRTPPATTPTPTDVHEDPPVYDTEGGSGAPAAGGGKAVGLFSIAVGLWLLLGRK